MVSLEGLTAQRLLELTELLWAEIEISIKVGFYFLVRPVLHSGPATQCPCYRASP